MEARSRKLGVRMGELGWVMLTAASRRVGGEKIR